MPTANSEPWGITAGPDGDLWFTETASNNVARAPACGLGLSASLGPHSLTMNFDLGIDTPAIRSVSAGKEFGLKRPIRAVAPPKPFTLDWKHFPNNGAVKVKSTLSDDAGHALCSEWVTVDTAQ